MPQGQGALLPPLGEHGEQPQTWRPRAGHGEKVGTDLRVLARVVQRQRPRASLSPLTAWVENATAAQVLCQGQTLMMGRLPKSVSGLPGWNLLLPGQVGLTRCRGRCRLPVDLGEGGMPCCPGQGEHTVGAAESHQAGQLQLQAERGEHLLTET